MHANVRIHDHGWIAVAPDDEAGFGQAVACGDILAKKCGERSLRVGGDAREKPLKLWPLFASNIHPVMIRLFRIGDVRIAKINYTGVEHYWCVYQSCQQHCSRPTGLNAESNYCGLLSSCHRAMGA
jgi:hypothetical protein